MIPERTIHFAQRVADLIFGYRVRYAVQVMVIDRKGFSRMLTVGYACDLAHAAKLRDFLL